MIPDPQALPAPAEGTPSELLGWRPSGGVISIYIAIDPSERRPGWHTAVRNGLSAARENGGDDHAHRAALEATTSRLEADLLEEERKGDHRGLIGFVEVAAENGEERWYATQIPPRRTEVTAGPVAQVHQLLELLDDGAPLGVATVSSERIRLLDWRLGRIEELHDWELSYFGDDWRERKSERPRDPARGEGVSASGHDRHHQRLEANRERFADQAGRLAHGESRGRGWRTVLVFGDQRYVSRFTNGLGGDSPVVRIDRDLVSEPRSAIERAVEQALPDLNRRRETELIDRIREAAYMEGRSSLGPQETLQALGEGRVEHLVYDAGREYEGPERANAGGANGLIERMVEMAFATGAKVTPVEGESARGLDTQDGVAALLRY